MFCVIVRVLVKAGSALEAVAVAVCTASRTAKLVEEEVAVAVLISCASGPTKLIVKELLLSGTGDGA
jgi:hypothetical protein